MRRRDFIAGLGVAAAARPLATRARSASMPLIGVLNSTSGRDGERLMSFLVKGLAQQGYAAGSNLAIEYRWADGHYERLPALAAELVHLKVEVIVAGGGLLPIKAALAASAKQPIVFTTGDDPVKAGLVASLSRPGGNATGVSVSTEIGSKRLDLLHELLPGAHDFGVIVDPKMRPDALDAAAARLGVSLHSLPVENEGGLDAAFAELARLRVGGVLVDRSPLFAGAWVGRLVSLATRYALPTLYIDRRDVEAGGLASYGPDFGEAYYQAGLYVARILKGEKPGDLPVLQTRKFEFLINLKTAKALGLTVPSGVLAIADEVIE